MTQDLLGVVRESWSWADVDPVSVTSVSPFGHLILKDGAGSYWYLDPELRTVTRVADSDSDLIVYMRDPDVRMTWEAVALVDAARERLGTPGKGKCYSLKPHALLEGNYGHENICILPIAEMIGWTGDVERQLRDLPDGAKYQLKVVD